MIPQRGMKMGHSHFQTDIPSRHGNTAQVKDFPSISFAALKIDGEKKKRKELPPPTSDERSNPKTFRLNLLQRLASGQLLWEEVNIVVRKFL